MNILSSMQTTQRFLFIFLILSGASMFSQASNTILVFGDSLSAGYGLQTGEEWPHLLQLKLQQEKTPFTVVNASISGETTAGGLARFQSTFDKYKPAIVILELGANDGLRGQDLLQMKMNLSRMLEYSLSHKARVLLIGMKIPPNYGKRYTDAFQATFVTLKKEHIVELIPFLLEDLISHKNMLQNDGLHPNAKAQPIILTTVLKSLKPLLQMSQ